MRLKNLLLVFVLFTNIFYLSAISVDGTNIENLVPYAWSPISDIDKVLQHEDIKLISKGKIKFINSAKIKYNDAFNKMKNKEYSAAISIFLTAMKDYKRARLNEDALNFIRVNMALCHTHTGNKEDLVVAKRYLSLLSSKVYADDKWMYNIAIAEIKTDNQKEAINLLSQLIRNDEFNFQAYITLEAIYKDAGKQADAKKVRQRLQTAEARFIRKKQLVTNNPSSQKIEKKVFTPKGVTPDVCNLKIVKKDDHLQFKNIDKIDERSMTQIQEGISEYNIGAEALANKEYKKAQTHLKNAEKKFKRGKIGDDGLSFTRGNLAIAYLSSGEKRGVNQAKRYLKYLTPKIYKSREWTYNLAVAHYAFASKQRSKNTKKEYLNKAIKYLRWSIKYDKLFLPAHENLIFIYKELEENSKAQNAQYAYEKARKSLMKSFSKQEQIDQGGEPYIFRINLGTYEEFGTPVGLFDQDNLIIVPISDSKTTYLAGLFDNLESAISYQKSIKKSGYTNPFIVAFKDGEKVEF